MLIKRRGYVIREYHITGQGTCPQCGTKVPGLWPSDPAKIRLNGNGMPVPL
jgi:pyruvate formate lyase activating enzyme